MLEAVAPAGVRRLAGTREVKLLRLAEGVAARLGELKLKSPQQRKALEVLAASDRAAHGKRASRTRRLHDGADSGAGQGRSDRSDASLGSDLSRPLSDGVGKAGGNRGRTAPSSTPISSRALDSILAALDSREPAACCSTASPAAARPRSTCRPSSDVVSFGRQAIVLVPEISLTPQTVRRFAARFARVAVLHSHLTDAERHAHWQAIARGEVQVVVGARSAVFAPTPHLGLIVIDEEHETTFKQDTAPRYHARDVAWQRAEAEGVPLVLGTATPSLESWQRTPTGEFELLVAAQARARPAAAAGDDRRPARPRPNAVQPRRDQPAAASGDGAALRDGGQVMLLLNRRGFATHIQCPACGFVLKCPHCDLALTYHRQHNAALCHYCDYETPPPTACPDCKSPAIRYGGLGTQKLEMEVRSAVSRVHACRGWTATRCSSRGSHDEVLGAFQRGEIHILLGTQMIAKGLDFPNVTLVGVINADTALHLPDFRAAERTFQLIAQVAGRTGRGKQGGRVLVQTLSPDHPAIAAAVRHDYRAFADARAAAPQGAAAIRRIRRWCGWWSAAPQEATVRADSPAQLGERLRGASRRRRSDPRARPRRRAHRPPARRAPVSAPAPGPADRRAASARPRGDATTSSRPKASSGPPTSTRGICSRRLRGP